jgi:phospholipid/cholesterol/gamma-HCH transport system substrate-binding protein
MEIKARYVLIGLFTLATLVAGFAFVYWLETTGGLGKRTSYEVRFHNTVSGLLAGSPVLFDGIRVGEVTGLKLVPKDPKEIDVTISIDANTPVRSDTKASLDFQGLTGVAVVTLTGGSAGAPPLEASAGQLPKLTASETAGQTMSEAARQAFTRIDKVLAENSGDLRTMVSNLTSFSEALGKNSGKVDAILGGLERMTGGGKAAGLVYDLSALPASTEEKRPLEKQITVADPSALLTYDSERILAQVDGNQLAPIGNARWADSLTKLVQSRIIQSFENTGSLNEVIRPSEGGAPELQLTTEIRKFQIVNAPERTAEVQIAAKVIAADGHIVAARIFDGGAPVKSTEDADAAKALNEAFGKVLSALIPWTSDVVAGGGEKSPPAPAQPKRRGQARG